MNSVIYVGWDDGTSLYHYGIPGQKWGNRRFQNLDGSLTPEGRARYLTGTDFGNRGYTSSASRNALKKGGSKSEAYKASKAYDEKITKYVNNTSAGKNFLKNYLAGPSGAMTYNMARAAGESRGKAFARTVLDINIGTLVGSLATTGITNKLGGNDTTKLNFDYDYDNNKLGIKADTKKGSALGRIAGVAAGYGAQVAVRNSGSELSLQQRALRRKYGSAKKR